MVKLFTVYDSKIKSYMDPFMAMHTGQAMRSWAESVNDPKSTFHKYPEDFTLFELGTFDSNTGGFELLNTPHAIATAVSVKDEPVSAIPLFDRQASKAK